MIPVSEHITCFRAHNPSPMTLDGTNCYIVSGSTGAWLIDAGPDEAEHLAAMAASIRVHGLALRAILLTHTHSDHTDGLISFRQITPAPIYAFKDGYDRRLTPGETLELDGQHLTVIHTPGHAGDCICFFHQPDGVLIAGDTILGIGTSVIAPPEGNVSDYLDSLERLKAYPAKLIAPGHGPMIADPRAKIDEYIEHRLMRERQIIAQLSSGPKTIEAMVAEIYKDVDKSLHGAAGWSVRAHLSRLEKMGKVRADGERWALIQVA
ncbi:MAG: MBL fold metallo-hydrolase [Chloroflexi bacterium]|nr:MBL fold metallo-hydrolase [Chloroflexota bacterium]